MRRLGIGRGTIASVATTAIVGLLQPLVGQVPPEAESRLVVADGVATRVATIGLDQRSPGSPVLVLISGGVTRLEHWADWMADIAELAHWLRMTARDRRVGIRRAGTRARGCVRAPGRPSLGARRTPAIRPCRSLLGGPLILHYAGRREGDVVGMVYLDPMNPRETQLEMFGARTEAQYEELSRLQRETVQQLPPGGARAEGEAMTVFQTTPVDGRDLPSDPRVPTAIVIGMPASTPPSGAPAFWTEQYGVEWMTSRAERITRWVASMPQATLYFAPGSGHFVHQMFRGSPLRPWRGS